MPQKRDSFFQSVLSNDRLQIPPLWSFSSDHTFKTQTTGAELGAGAHKKCVILHGMQTADRKESEVRSRAYAIPLTSPLEKELRLCV